MPKLVGSKTDASWNHIQLWQRHCNQFWLCRGWLPKQLAKVPATRNNFSEPSSVANVKITNHNDNKKRSCLISLIANTTEHFLKIS